MKAIILHKKYNVALSVGYTDKQIKFYAMRPLNLRNQGINFNDKKYLHSMKKGRRETRDSTRDGGYIGYPSETHLKHTSSITSSITSVSSVSVVQSFRTLAQITAVILLCSVQNYKTIVWRTISCGQTKFHENWISGASRMNILCCKAPCVRYSVHFPHGCQWWIKYFLSFRS